MASKKSQALKTFLRVSAEPDAMPDDSNKPLPRATTDAFQRWAANTIGRMARQIEILQGSLEAQQQTIRELSDLAFKDSLTGLYNRHYLVRELGPANNNDRRIARGDQILFIDLSRFKEINDTYGHDVGDQALRRTAEFLTECVRKSDIVARLGGDEFIVFLRGADEKAAMQKTLMIKQGFENLFITVNGGEIPVRGNVGVYPIDDPQLSLEAMINAADAAMYRDKTSKPGYKPRERQITGP